MCRGNECVEAVRFAVQCTCPNAWSVGKERGLHKEILLAGYL